MPGSGHPVDFLQSRLYGLCWNRHKEASISKFADEQNFQNHLSYISCTLAVYFWCRANLSRLRFRKVSGLSPSGANPLYVYRPVCLTPFPDNLYDCG